MYKVYSVSLNLGIGPKKEKAAQDCVILIGLLWTGEFKYQMS
jgi:hypothetical protein